LLLAWTEVVAEVHGRVVVPALFGGNRILKGVASAKRNYT
jgi:hypothetical protein